MYPHQGRSIRPVAKKSGMFNWERSNRVVNVLVRQPFYAESDFGAVDIGNHMIANEIMMRDGWSGERHPESVKGL